MTYDDSRTLQRIGKIANDCFDEKTLELQVPYGSGQREVEWNRILDIVYEVNASTEEKADIAGKGGRIEPLTEFL